MKKIFSFLKVLFVLILSNCALKVVDQSKLINFKVDRFTSGDSRISYIIKNKLLPYSNNTEKNYRLRYRN